MKLATVIQKNVSVVVRYNYWPPDPGWNNMDDLEIDAVFHNGTEISAFADYNYLSDTLLRYERRYELPENLVILNAEGL